jgi:hypothetical protein
MSFLSSLSDQRLLDAAGAADDLARNGSEGGQVVAGIVGQAITDEIVERLGRS